jgi:hypothetical protein
MSESGHSRRFDDVGAMSGLPPDSDRIADIAGDPFRATNRLMRRSSLITSSAEVVLRQIITGFRNSVANKILLTVYR